MSSPSAGAPVEKKKLPRTQLAVAAVVLMAVAGIVLWAVGWKTALEVSGKLIDEAINLIAAAGPWVFFAAMTLLPCLGMPMLAFTLTVGSAFGAQLGMGTVVALSLAAVTANLVITYWLARLVLRAPLERLIARLGYRMPEVGAGDAMDLTVILRVTPGIPFFVQNYLLGLANVPFVSYVIVSCLITWSYSAGFVLFGDALRHGQGKMILTAGGLIVAASAATHLVRKHYGARKKAA